MFEAKTYDNLMAEVLARFPPDIDTRQGSIAFDSVSAVVNTIAKNYADLEQVFKIVFITTSFGEYLDLRASEYGIYRRAPTTAKYLFEYEGTRPPTGWRFFHQESGNYFRLAEVLDGPDTILCLEAEVGGAPANYIQPGDIAVPVDTVTGLAAATFGGIFECGTDAEDDESLRTRTLEYISGPARNGNRQHYKTWCESVDGVGMARIQPLWNGENTVRAILISPYGLPVAETVRDAVQRYVDPADKGMTVTIDGKTYVVGDGLGNGVANVGAHFTAVSAEAVYINLAFTAELARSRTPEEVAEAVAEAMEEYLRELVELTASGELATVRVSAVGGVLSRLTKSLVDFQDLTLNGGTANILIGHEQVPVRGEVTINVLH